MKDKIPHLFTKKQYNRLLANGQKGLDIDHIPVILMTVPWHSASWLLTAILPDNKDILIGLCDLGNGYPEVGYVSIDELLQIEHPVGLKLERNKYFKATYPLSVYVKAARNLGRITISDVDLEPFA
ncbi:hypothetical protein DDZ13_09645 [Coraliomargarita sinensis]|uniref:DUF2958 domain-containing protein n=1 Tax=Coraliomargarita sinensis TaxID=2174842 RepID=A0A317ZI51_9BACT|nr:DUF2958 domain-containing protein [Coraliomargarita sinensis]PXA03893.1 hypothetical protein DDZ13_09645 [Coraliomargarita sinensis]